MVLTGDETADELAECARNLAAKRSLVYDRAVRAVRAELIAEIDLILDAYLDTVKVGR